MTVYCFGFVDARASTLGASVFGFEHSVSSASNSVCVRSFDLLDVCSVHALTVCICVRIFVPKESREIVRTADGHE